MIGVCQAPAGSCGFRGRDWRKGAPGRLERGRLLCQCGSEMRPIHEGVTVDLTPAQISAVEIYMTDPAHEGEYQCSLVGRKLVFAPGVTVDQACGFLSDASNSAGCQCDATEHNLRESTSLDAIRAKIRRQAC